MSDKDNKIIELEKQVKELNEMMKNVMQFAYYKINELEKQVKELNEIVEVFECRFRDDLRMCVGEMFDFKEYVEYLEGKYGEYENLYDDERLNEEDEEKLNVKNELPKQLPKSDKILSHSEQSDNICDFASATAKRDFNTMKKISEKGHYPEDTSIVMNAVYEALKR